MENIKHYDIKLPSHYYVSVDKIWDTCKVIAKTGRVFTTEDLQNHGSTVNAAYLPRVLSYLRYLGILEERREKSINAETEVIQKWQVKSDKNSQDMIFLLEDNRENESSKMFGEILRKNDIYLSLSKEKFENEKRAHITIVELKDFLRVHDPGKRASYYDSGANFVKDLFQKFGLIRVEGNRIVLLTTIPESSDPATSAPKEKDISTPNTADSLPPAGAVVFSLKGKGINFEFKLDSEDDIESAKSLLDSPIIKKKLKEAV